MPDAQKTMGAKKMHKLSVTSASGEAAIQLLYSTVQLTVANSLVKKMRERLRGL